MYDEELKSEPKDDALSVIQELDAILDIHEESTGYAMCDSSGVDCDLENHVQDCLKELDIYLEQIDENDDSTMISFKANQSCLPSNSEDHVTLNAAPVCIRTTGSNNNLQRCHGTRKTISCPADKQFNYLKKFTNRNCLCKDAYCINNLKDINMVKSEEECAAKAVSVKSNTTQLCLTPETITQNTLETSTPPHHHQDNELISLQCERQDEACSQTSITTADDNANCEILNQPIGTLLTHAAVAYHTNFTSMGGENENNGSSNYNAPITSDGSTIRSSQNTDPVSIVSSSSSSVASESLAQVDAELVFDEITNNTDDAPISTTKRNYNATWPYNCSRTIALLSCSLGLFNVCRFGVLTINYGGNFLLQFLLLSIVFGIPFFWLQMCLGAKIKEGPISMWRISPICTGVDFSLVIVQFVIALYSSVVMVWILLYLLDTLTYQSSYRWMVPIFHSMQRNQTQDDPLANLTDNISNYFNIVILKRMKFMLPPLSLYDERITPFRINDHSNLLIISKLKSSMNAEEERLRSFSLWPDNAPISSVLLAEGGFYSTGRFLEAECNWCHCRISDWEYGDIIDERHRLISPQCVFILDRTNCGNISNSCSIASNSQQCTDLILESNRLATFKNWPNPNISPESLAKAGFFYLNRSDEVKCVWCKGVLVEWEKNDNAFNEHRRFFPECPRVQLGPLIEMASYSLRDLEIQQVTPAKNPKYMTLEARLRTYSKWPIPSIQKPVDLAQAGLYYQEVDDQVRCFYCNIRLRSWEKEDDPWFEHAKWYPQCQFVRLVRGNSYVQQVLELMKQSVPQPNQTPISSMSIEEAMCTVPVRQALEMGIDVGAIRSKTQQQLTVLGRPYSTVEDLIKAVFDDRETDNYGGDNSNNSTTTGEENVRNLITEPNMQRVSRPLIGSNCNQQRTSTSNIVASRQVNTDGAVSKSPKFQTHPNERQFTGGHSVQDPCKGKSLECITLEEENRKLKDARLCKVCLDEVVGVVYLPCGHLVTCVQCAPSVEKCPLCRTTIKGFVRTFL